MTTINDLSLETLRRVPLADLATLSPEDLADLQARIDAATAIAKAARSWFDQALDLRYSNQAHAARLAAGKDTGTVRLVDGAVTVVADLPKKVDWDQRRLAAIVERIRAAGDDPDDYVETAFKVSERKYSAWPPAIRDAFMEARTVRTGKPSFKLVLDGGDA